MPVSSAPKVCMSVAARALETPKSCSMSRRVSSSRVQRLELTDGVGDGDQPAGLGEHRGAPCRLQPMRRVRVGKIDGAHTAGYISRWSSNIEEMQRGYRAPTIKQHLAAIRRLFDWLVTGQP